MKHIKKFEGSVIDEYIKKSEEYKKYNDKYIVFESRTEDNDGIFLGQFKKIILNGFFAKINLWEKRKISGKEMFIKIADDLILHIDSFTILEVFDNIVDAEESYELLKNSNSYNL